MPFCKISYSEENRCVRVHNHGCNFRCCWCRYRLPKFPTPLPSLKVDEIKSKLRELDLEAVHFVHFADGEPATAPDLPHLLAFCKNELGVTARLGHTNGSLLPTENLDGANVGFKAFDPQHHLDYTGYPREPVYEGFTRAFQAGVELKASVVLSPGHVECNEIERICEFVASHDTAIPFNITGYRTVPWLDWRRPTLEEMEEAVTVAKRHLETVSFKLHADGEHVERKHGSKPRSWATVLGEARKSTEYLGISKSQA